MTKQPAWWKAGHFEKEDEWDVRMEPTTPHLRVVVEVTEWYHDGYCSDGVEDSYEAMKTKMIGWVPLKDERGANWDWQVGMFNPGLKCPTGGSGAHCRRPSAKFVSMVRIG